MKQKVLSKKDIARLVKEELKERGVAVHTPMIVEVLDTFQEVATRSLSEGVGFTMRGFMTVELRERAEKICYASGGVAEARVVAFAKFHNQFKDRVRSAKIAYKGSDEDTDEDGATEKEVW